LDQGPKGWQELLSSTSARGLMVMIERRQRLDPGSIPGGRTFAQRNQRMFISYCEKPSFGSCF
jgi:hypothetical protein